MNFRYFYTLLLMALLSYGLSAQSVIKGTITDATTGEALPGASVYIPELLKGASAGEDGSFVIRDLPSGKVTIEFSFVGFGTEAKKVVLDRDPVILDMALQPTVIRTQEVVVTSSGYTTQHENAVKIETLGPGGIVNPGYMSLPAALTQIPGVDMISKGNGVVKPVIRGLSNSNIVMLNNGIKLENYQFSENHPYVVDESGIDKVEVIKGPASLLYGSDAIGGIISIIPEKPADAQTLRGDAFFRCFSNTYGYATGFGIKGAGKKNYWGIRAGIKSHEDYRDGNGHTVFNSRFVEQNIKMNTGRRTKNGSFGLFYNYNTLKAGMVTPQALTLVTEKGRDNEYWYQDLTSHLLHSKNKVYAGRYRFSADLSWQNNRRKLHTNEKNEVDMTQNTLAYELKSWLPSGENSEYIIGFQGAANYNTNNEGHQKVLPDFNQYDAALFGLAQHTFRDRSLLQAGLRFEFREIHAPEQPAGSHSHKKKTGIYVAEEEILTGLEKSYNNLSFSTGGTWQANHFLHIRANLASGYRTPNIAELTQNGVHGPRYEQGNRGLTSQRNYEADMSLHFHTQFIELDLAGFYNRVNDYIYLAPTEKFEEDMRIYRYSQKDALLRGIEAYMRFHPEGNLRWEASYSFVRGRMLSGGNLPFIPHGKLHFEAKYMKARIRHFQDVYLFLGATLAFDQRYPSEFETSTGGYALFSAGFGFDIETAGQVIEISVSGTNLVSSLYADHLSTLKPMGIFNTGRNLMLSVRVPFSIMNRK
ncbi:MAG: TonB-dependent receptor [Bacteroidales bacterium]|nr:TonB-dependent receptor [Bacteroidales bacterium]